MSRLSSATSRVPVVLAFVASVLMAPPLSGQEGPAVTVLGGAAAYDLSGTGTSWVAGASAEISPVSPLVVEPGVRLFRYGPRFAPEVAYLFPELSVQAQLPLGRVRPYLGGGAGAGFVLEGRASDEFTLHAALGARIRLDRDWSLRPEFRVRSVDPWVGSTGDFTVGLSRRW